MQVAAGDEHNCALRTDGTVLCWGRNEDGQIGTGLTSESEPVPYEVPLSTTAVEVQARDDFSCARDENERVWCWGRNDVRQINPNAGPVVVNPTEVPEAVPAQRLRLGERFACVHDADGLFTCWGRNNRNQLFTSSSTSPNVSGPHLAAAVEGFTLGYEHGCMWSTTTLECWGSNRYAQAGNGTSGQDYASPTPPTFNVTDIAAFAAGGYHSCLARTGEDPVWCWGRDHNGQVTGNAAGPQTLPVAVPVGITGTVVQMTAQASKTCLLTDLGEVVCWGSSLGGDLGTEVPNEQLLFPPARVVVVDDELPEPPAEISLGGNHMCARAQSGRVWCWGRSSFGQRGNGNPEPGHASVEIDLGCE